MYFAPYIQDDWKVSSKLTLNLGLRYDYRNVPYETNDHMAWRNLDYAPGGLLVADQSLAGAGVVDGAYYQEAGRRSPENPDRYKVFAPRHQLRVPSRPRPATRSSGPATGSSTTPPSYARSTAPRVSIRMSAADTYSQTLGQTAPLQTTDQLFPSFTGGGVATPAANCFLAVNQSPEPRNPKVQQWSLGIQRQFAQSTTAELNYVGAHGATS